MPALLPLSTTLAVAVGASLLCACATTTPLQPWLHDDPLVRHIDAKVGTIALGAARIAVVSNPLLRIDVGKESVARFERVFASQFTHVSALADWPPWREAVPALDGVIELQRTDAELQLGNDAGGWFARAFGGGSARPDVVRIAYRICLLRPNAREVGCWTPTATASYQRGPGECLDLRPCVAAQMEAAMREAIARYLVDFEADPAVQAWAAGLRQR